MKSAMLMSAMVPDVCSLSRFVEREESYGRKMVLYSRPIGERGEDDALRCSGGECGECMWCYGD